MRRSSKINDLRTTYIEIIERMLLVITVPELQILKDAIHGDPQFTDHIYRQVDSEIDVRVKKGACLADAEVVMRRLKIGG